MPKFIIKRTFKLDFLGEEWKDCSLVFNCPSIDEARNYIKNRLEAPTTQESLQVTKDYIATHFIEGTAYDSETKTVIKVTPEMIGEMPSLISAKITFFLIGDSPQSTPSTN